MTITPLFFQFAAPAARGLAETRHTPHVFPHTNLLNKILMTTMNDLHTQRRRRRVWRRRAERERERSAQAAPPALLNYFAALNFAAPMLC